MTCWAIVPIKAPDQCKTRLRPALSDAARLALVAAMARQVVDAAQASAGVDKVLLLGPSRHGLPAATPLLADGGAALNTELARATQAAADLGVTRLIIVAADLPHIAVEDFDALAAPRQDAVAVAPDHKGAGTNALSLPLPQARAFQFHYGAESFARHCAEAARLGLGIEMIGSPGLAEDVDEPEDLARLPGWLSDLL